jgi:ribosomal protein L29
MKFNELQNKDGQELQVMLKETKVKLGKLRFEMANKTLKDSSQIGKARKEIAQIMTVLKAQSLANK